MCGIIGILGGRSVSCEIFAGLRRLEYRGYDSSGIATINPKTAEIDSRRAPGKLHNLETLLQQNPLTGSVGIGHTRWATHGAPTAQNAHPHSSTSVSVVHNGIIENFAQLREKLMAEGFQFSSETDTEVVAHLIQHHLNQAGNPVEAVRRTLPQLQGAFALGIIFAGHNDIMIGARRNSPLAIGFGEQQTDGSMTPMFLGSDSASISPWTQRICHLEENDWVVLRPGQASIYDAENRLVNREIKLVQISNDLIGKGDYRHFMEKEIFEQPRIIQDTLDAYFSNTDDHIRFNSLNIDFKNLSRLTIIACGTSFYAGQVAKYWFEKTARIFVECDIASEYRYREAPIDKDEVALFISQSGETSDTLAALRYCKENGAKIISLVNVLESSIARESDVVLQTLAGPEIGVASTKAFTAQLTLLAGLAIYAGQERGHVSDKSAKAMFEDLAQVPSLANGILKDQNTYADLGHRLADCRDIIFIGRGGLFPIAMEGALKLKEISYIHAEGYAAGEMKHGPIALIDDNIFVIAVLHSGSLFEKTLSNCAEAAARGGRILALTDSVGLLQAEKVANAKVVLPAVSEFIAPIIYAFPMQLLAYYTALSKGTDIDQPRNLAKSVTVE